MFWWNCFYEQIKWWYLYDIQQRSIEQFRINKNVTLECNKNTSLQYKRMSQMSRTNRERKFQGVNTLENKSSMERKFLGHFALRSERAREQMGQGAKGPRGESSRERFGQSPIGWFAPGSELAWERKSCESFCLQHQNGRVATRPGFAPCCPASRQDQPRDAKCPVFQGAVKMTIIIK